MCPGRIRVILDGMSGTSTQMPKPPGMGSFEDTIKDFWASRPRRPYEGRKIAGVAAAVGNRYGIDPVIVRVALVAATIFGGVGVVLYLLGWLFFADERDQSSAIEGLLGKGRSSTSAGFTVLLCAALIPASGWTFGGGWFDGGGFIGLGLLTAGLYLLHRSRGQRNRPVPNAVTAEDYGYSAYATPFTEAATGADGTRGWDPLGSAPLGWDLPGPAPEPAPGPREPAAQQRCGSRSKVTMVTFGLALLVVAAGVALAIGGVSWFSPPHIAGLALAVVGVGLVAGSFLQGGRGLIGLAVPLSVAGIALTVIAPGPLAGGMGTIEATPHTAADVQPLYARSLGGVFLDLRELPADVPVATAVETSVGTSEVMVSETADVTYTCSNSAGNVECLGKEAAGVGEPNVSGQDFGTDGPGGQQITLTVTSSAGNVEVRRG